MNQVTLPLPVHSRFASLRPRLFAALLSITLAAVAHAQMIGQSAPSTFADIASADHILAGNAPAFHALLDGRVAEAASLLQVTLSQNPSDATAHQLLCRVFYAQDQADAAIRQCELATAADPSSSDNHLWLGRAYGMKARHAGPIAGFSLARKVHVSFERAVQLGPNSVSASSDLGEYYIAAPSIVGGGDDKARALTARMMPQFPSAAHRLIAMLAESDKDLATAESEYRQAITAAHSPADHSPAEAWIDLAQFYQTHNRPDDAVAAIRSGLAADRTHGPVLVDAASILTNAHREPALAERCLNEYLASRSRSDAAPTFKVHLQLSRLLAARGDQAGSSREVASAAALAPAFTRTRSSQGS